MVSELEEKQMIVLKRQWEMLENTKSLRLKVPLIMNGLVIGITGFLIKNKIPNESVLSGFISSFLVASLAIFGYVALKSVHKQYEYRNGIIISLYRKLGFLEENILGEISEEDSAISIFRASYLSFIIIACICITAIVNASY